MTALYMIVLGWALLNLGTALLLHRTAKIRTQRARVATRVVIGGREQRY